jgi:hydroxymethylbilane synthase
VPIGALAEVKSGRLALNAMVGRPDGSQILRYQAEGRDPEKLGKEAATALMGKGADAILRDIYGKDLGALQQP